MTNLSKLFILVDDDPLSNLLLKKVIEKNLDGAVAQDFITPELALKYIETQFVHTQLQEKITLFLDINMPTITGWEFLDEFERFEAHIKNQFQIYILSSSIDPADIQRAKLNPYVKDFVEKPINKDFLVRTFYA
jgi:CheY-like chemotaxis protein